MLHLKRNFCAWSLEPTQFSKFHICVSLSLILRRFLCRSYVFPYCALCSWMLMIKALPFKDSLDCGIWRGIDACYVLTEFIFHSLRLCFSRFSFPILLLASRRRWCLGAMSTFVHWFCGSFCGWRAFSMGNCAYDTWWNFSFQKFVSLIFLLAFLHILIWVRSRWLPFSLKA